MVVSLWRCRRRIAQLLGRVRRRDLPPTSPSIERLAADLRRLSTALQSAEGRRTAARHDGLVGAYEHTLRAACDALGVRYELDDGLTGLARELEYARMEAELQAAGLRTRRPSTRSR
ncbi:MAG: hypothetical protein WCA46_05380 [Actinocatenispora sp.]